MPVETDWRAIGEISIDVLLPQIARFNDVHIRIHRSISVLHVLPRQVAKKIDMLSWDHRSVLRSFGF
jgi:hypothetical protein